MADLVPDWPRLLSLAVHELRSPANVISGYVGMMLRGHGGVLNDVQRDALEQVAQSCDRLVGFLADMSEVARLADGRLESAVDRVDIGDLLADAAANYEPTPGTISRMAAVPPASPCPVSGDRSRLSRAVRVLAALIARNEGDGTSVVATGRRVEDEVVIAISPARHRLDPAEVGPLESLDDLTGGHGVAIPLARMAIETVGGRVGVPTGPTGRANAAVIVLPLARLA
jgi:two-component system sensor histidine kinase KdpD